MSVISKSLRMRGMPFFAGIAFSLALSGCSLLGDFSPLAPVERAQLFHPVKYPNGNWKAARSPIEDAWFTADDGTKLHGWFLPHSQPRAVVLFAHGNAGNVSHRLQTLRELHSRQQVSVLVFDYRGYGRSKGKPSETGLMQDARAARKWLANRAGVAERNIVLMGRSLGGGVMVDLAAPRRCGGPGSREHVHVDP